MAENEMTAMRGMLQCVRLSEGLGVSFIGCRPQAQAALTFGERSYWLQR
jgi:hypothetical protein